jgi:aryl-alcohol dehydrogenase-like predicted oxidoreductase
MEFGSKTSEEEATRLFDLAMDAGINVVDTANIYAGGLSEQIVGRLIGPKTTRSPSESVVPTNRPGRPEEKS